jgi:intein-encoded DNA endonuclease-like protein
MQTVMARTSTLAAHDQHTDGEISRLLREWRAEDVTYELIARRLRLDHGIDVTTSTVFRWCRSLERAA